MPYDWEPLMKEWNDLLLASPSALIDDETRRAGWLGFPGATEEQIVALEQRLGRGLPPSYREFLAYTNGWRTTGAFIDRIWGTEDVDWFRARNQEWIDAWTEGSSYYGEVTVSDAEYFVYGPEQDPVHMRNEYLKTALEVSEEGDEAILLLNPQITFDDEWEAWFFSNWSPGADRYRSFWDLMVAQYESAKRLR